MTMMKDHLHGDKKRFEPETVIFEEGDLSDYMYVVLSGEVVIYKKVIQNATRVLHIVKEGEYFGEMSLIAESGTRRSASAKAIKDTEVVQIDKEGLYNLLKEKPEFGLNIIRQMSDRLARTSEILIYSELDLALSRLKPSRFEDGYHGKILFILTGSFDLENKEAVLKTANTLKWSKDVDVVASVFKPGNTEESLIYIVAADNLNTLQTTISHFNNLVRWDFSPVLPTNIESTVS